MLITAFAKGAPPATASSKGGVGKTTVAVNLGVELTRQKIKTVVVDLDAQGSATYALGLVPDKQAGFDLWLKGEKVLQTHRAVPLIPSGAATAYIKWNSPQLLTHALSTLEADVVLLDCPPSLVPSTVAALVNAHRVLVPVLADPLVLVGLAQILDTLSEVNQTATGVRSKTVGGTQNCDRQKRLIFIFIFICDRYYFRSPFRQKKGEESQKCLKGLAQWTRKMTVCSRSFKNGCTLP